MRCRVLSLIAVIALAGCGPAAPLPAFDECLRGTWRETWYSTVVDLTEGGGEVTQLTGAGRTLTFTADGTETVTYGDNAVYRGTDTAGRTAEARITGTVRLQVTTTNGEMAFTVLNDDVTVRYLLDGRTVRTATFGNPRPVKYTCTKDRHTQDQEMYQARYERG